MAITLENIPDIPAEPGFIRLNIVWAGIDPKVVIGSPDKTQREEELKGLPKLVDLEPIIDGDYRILEKKAYGADSSLHAYGPRVNLTHEKYVSIPLNRIIKIKVLKEVD